MRSRSGRRIKRDSTGATNVPPNDPIKITICGKYNGNDKGNDNGNGSGSGSGSGNGNGSGSGSSSSSGVSMDVRSEEEIFKALQNVIYVANNELLALKRKVRVDRVETSIAIGFLANPVHYNEKCIGFQFGYGINDKGPLGHRTQKGCEVLEELFVTGFTPDETSDESLPKKQRTLKEVHKEKYSSYKLKSAKVDDNSNNDDDDSDVGEVQGQGGDNDVA